MNTVNFICSGLIGDFINSLCACKNICERDNVKANLYIADGYLGDPFRYGVKKAFEDTYDLIIVQDYINKYGILPVGFSEPFINLNKWRTEVHGTYKKTGGYNKCWSELLSQTFNYPITEYKWLTVPPINADTSERILIHRSRQRHNNSYPDYIKNLKERSLFITSNKDEYDNFEYRDLADIYLVNTITEMAIAIRSCKLFIGNQSSPFALASALDVNRVCELDSGDASPFYLGEEKHSKKIKFL